MTMLGNNQIFRPCKLDIELTVQYRIKKTLQQESYSVSFQWSNVLAFCGFQKAPRYLQTKSKAHFTLKRHDYGAEDNLGVQWHRFIGELFKKN